MTARKLLPFQVLWLEVQLSAWGQTHLLRAVPVTSPIDERSPAAKAYQWASRIMIVSLEMVLPGLGGYWIDKKLGTVVVFTLLGFALGGIAAVIHLLRMTRLDQDRGKTRL